MKVFIGHCKKHQSASVDEVRFVCSERQQYYTAGEFFMKLIMGKSMNYLNQRDLAVPHTVMILSVWQLMKMTVEKDELAKPSKTI